MHGCTGYCISWCPMQILQGTCSDLQLHMIPSAQNNQQANSINNSKTYVSYHQNLNKKILKIKIWFLEHPKGPRDVGSLRDVVRAGHVTCTSRHAHAIKTVALPNTFLIITEQYCTVWFILFPHVARRFLSSNTIGVRVLRIFLCYCAESEK